MTKPEVGSKVTFILGGGPNAGVHRTAIILSHWSGDPVASALKVGKSLEEFEATDGMRMTLDVQVDPQDRHSTEFVVRHAEHDPKALLHGTWH